MSFRQWFLKLVYPLYRRMVLFTLRSPVVTNAGRRTPYRPIYPIVIMLNNGREMPLSQLGGMKILIVNTASNCGYTEQYRELQQLQDCFNGALCVLAIPSADFKNQEPGDDEQIREFCVSGYGIRFPVALKSAVLDGPGQHPVFRWLTKKEFNGWNDMPPPWNFTKYLVNESGMLTHIFHPAVSPLAESVLIAIAGRQWREESL